jgi:hypothetical protein
MLAGLGGADRVFVVMLFGRTMQTMSMGGSSTMRSKVS